MSFRNRSVLTRHSFKKVDTTFQIETKEVEGVSMELELDESAVIISDLVVTESDVIQKLKLDVFFLDDATI